RTSGSLNNAENTLSLYFWLAFMQTLHKAMFFRTLLKNFRQHKIDLPLYGASICGALEKEEKLGNIF
ncbi:MAG: hypothetical protein FWD47_03975, partial [Treponema sp.]|nr:hypothetical protein [Treponema sp.]